MIYFAVDKSGAERAFTYPPKDYNGFWMRDPKCPFPNNSTLVLPKGSIEKITGKQLTYTDGYITFPLGYSSH